MNKSYKVLLIFISILLGLSLVTSFSYGIWLSNQEDNDILSLSSNCLNLILNNDKVVLNKPMAISDDDGYGSVAYPFVIENKCGEDEQVELRLDTLEGSTIEADKLKIYVNGDVALAPTIISELVTTKAMDRDSIASNLVLKFQVNKGEVIRGNIRMWLNKDAVLLPNKEDYIGKIYFSTEETIIKPNFKEVLINKEGLENINNKGEIDYTVVEGNDTGLHAMEDNEGISYYYRGNVTNNYVRFADLMWRIIRINGNGSVRMILDSSINNTYFNDDAKVVRNVGYTYLDGENVVNSNVKNVVDNWYQENIVNKDYDKYLITEYFCNNTLVSSEQYSNIYYQEYENLYLNYTPVLRCGETEKDYGGVIRLKVGLITSSEVVLAGSSQNKPNNSYYLYNGSSFLTMSPIDYFNGRSYIGIVSDNGALNSLIVSEARDIRPVVNLSASTTVTGSGSSEDPYVVDVID